MKARFLATIPLTVAALASLTFTTGCRHENPDRRICVIAGDYPADAMAFADSVATGNSGNGNHVRNTPLSTDTLIFIAGNAVEGLTDAVADSLTEAYLNGAALIVVEPHSGEWLQLWRRMLNCYDNSSTEVTSGRDSDATGNIEAMRNEMIDVEGYTGREPMFRAKIADAIGIRGNDFYYLNDGFDSRGLARWLSGDKN